MTTDDNTPSFSVLIADYEATLKKYLVAVQNWTAAGYSIAEEVEQYITQLCNAIKIFKKLKGDGWQLAPAPDNYSYTTNCIYRGADIWEPTLNCTMIDDGIIGDIIALQQIIRCGKFYVARESNVIGFEIKKIGGFWVYARHLSLVPYDNLKPVNLSDGNTAWLTPETLKTIRDILAQR